MIHGTNGTAQKVGGDLRIDFPDGSIPVSAVIVYDNVLSRKSEEVGSGVIMLYMNGAVEFMRGAQSVVFDEVDVLTELRKM